MRRSTWIRSLGIAVVAALALSMGSRPSIRASQPSATIAAATVAGPVGGFAVMGDEPLPPSSVVHLAARPMSPEATRVWLKLQEKVPMQFANETPLEDVLKYIRSCTTDKADFPEGIPIYLNPAGLQEVEKAPQSPVILDLKGIPLATTLRLALDQLGLAYRIHPDGLVTITNKDAEDAPADADALILNSLAALRLEVRQLRAELLLLRTIRDDHPAPPAAAAPAGMGSKGGMM